MPYQGRGTRVVAIEVTADGVAWVDGSVVPTAPGSAVDQVRAAALRTVASIAAASGGPLRVDAREPDGTVWRLLVDPDGQVHDVAEALQEPLVPTPDGGGGDPAAEQSPLPYRQQLGAVTAAVDAERFEVGDYLALRLEKQVEADHGRGSAPWVRMREVRAHIAFLHGDFARAAELWIEVALEWVALAQPACWPAARNAHHCWLRIREVDEAVRIGHEVVAMWRQAGRDQQAQRALVHLDRVQIDGP